jgi:hypothetical protein
VTDAVASATQSLSATQTLAPVTGALDQLVGQVPVVGAPLHTALGSFSSATAGATDAIDATTGHVSQLAGTVFGPPSTSTGTGTTGASAGHASAASAPVVFGVDTPALELSTTASPAVVRPWASWPVPGTGMSAGAGAASGGTPPGPGHSSAPQAPPGTADGPPSGSAGGSGGSGGAVALLSTPLTAASAVVGDSAASDSDDRLPSTPTYDTDSTPD